MKSKVIIAIVGISIVLIFSMIRLIQSSEEPTRITQEDTIVNKVDTSRCINLK